MSALFRRETLWLPGHPYRPNYGRATLQCRMVLHGALGSVEFRWFTGITPERVDTRHGREWMHRAPDGSRVGYHFDAPRDYQTGPDAIFGEGHCDLRPSGCCYWDASYTDSDRVLETFLTEGVDAMWTALEQRYIDWVVDLSEEVSA